MMNGLAKRHLATFLFCCVYAVCLLNGAGISIRTSFAPWPYHRLQALALLDGRLHLSDSIYDCHFDTVVFDGKVQQVWGLGVGLWLAPFEVVARMIGMDPFPDRFALGVALVLFAYYSFTTAALLIKSGFRTSWVVGMLVNVLFAAPLINLLVNGPQSVYEDSSVYALIVSQGLLLALLRLIAKAQCSDYLILCTLAGVAGVFRPTHLCYGVIATLLATLLVRVGRMNTILISVGVMLFACGLGLLSITNYRRFGAVTEFGHKLTLTSIDGIVSSRFVNHMANASVSDASEELFGALFLVNRSIHEMGDWEDNMFPGQSNYFRWRNWYVTTFDITTLLLICMGAAAGALAWWRRCYRGSFALGDKSEIAQIMLLIWFSGTAIPLFAFMMYYPGLCSRYLYDFWPSFSAPIIVTWGLLSAKGGRLSLCILFGWLSYENLTSDCRMLKERHKSKEQVIDNLNREKGRTLESYNGRYDRHDHPSDIGMMKEVTYWDRSSGLTSVAVVLPVDRPEFVILDVGLRLTSVGSADRQDVYRAQIQGVELKVVEHEANMMSGRVRVRFEVPMNIQQDNGSRLLFVSFASVGDRADQLSLRPMHSVTWR